METIASRPGDNQTAAPSAGRYAQADPAGAAVPKTMQATFTAVAMPSL